MGSSFRNVINILSSAKDCDWPPDLKKTYFGYPKFGFIERLIDCYDYIYTDMFERILIPSAAVDKLRLAASANLKVFLDLREDYHEIIIYNRNSKE